jgi:phage-related protein
MSEIRICNFFDLETATGKRHFYQNYFIAESKSFLGQSYDFAPFQADGALANLNGDNQQLRVLFPAQELVVRLVEEGDGNRLSVLKLTTLWTNATGSLNGTQYTDYFVGISAGFSDSTVELRFRSSMDSVGSSFPARTLTTDNVGVLPLNAELYLR